MANRRWIVPVLVSSLLLTGALSCGKQRQLRPTPTVQPSPVLTASPTEIIPTSIPATPTPPPLVAISTPLPLPTDTPTPVPEVQFALDVDEAGRLIFPATEFVHGVARVYVRFVYQGLADVREVQSVWYLNENPVVSDTLVWDGGDAGAYVIWMEDLNGIERGQWRWELKVVNRTQSAGDDPLLAGTFTIGGEPRYVNTTWGLSLDPPARWEVASETESLVTFSSPDQRGALALRVVSATVGLTETAAADLALFRVDYPEAEVVGSQDVTMSGKKALLQQLNYTDEQDGDRLLYVVSSLDGDTAYSLWMLGPAADAPRLQTLLIATLRSIRFSIDD